MHFDLDKFSALVLYIIWKTSHREGFGATKLYKTLWFAEARVFETTGKPLAGETFIRDKHGPRSQHAQSVCEDLERSGLVERFSEHFYDYEVTRYRALQPPDTSRFTPEELGFVDWWIDFIDKHTATSISKLSHDYGWEIAAMGEVLPLHAYLAKKVRNPKSDDEVRWAQEEARRLGLK